MAAIMRFSTYHEARNFIKVSHFTVYKKTKNIGVTRVENADFQLKWEEKQGDLPIVFDGVPFVIIGKEDRECDKGPQRKKKKTNKTVDHTYGEKGKRRLIQETKKMGCPMKIKMRMIIRFPGYAIENDTAHYRRTSAQQLKAEFHNAIEQEYVVLLKVIGQHENHETGELTGYRQSLDKTTISKIQDLVLVDGLTDIGEIRRQIQAFSKLQHPDIQLSNRQYFPTMQDVRNHVYLALNNTRHSQDDQVNVQHLVTSWKESNPEDFYFFRAASINEGDEAVQPLLFIHQTLFQQHMLLKYGSQVVVMDSTYKTSKYELPLFFLCVSTNTGYMVVATFLLGKENRVQIREALLKILEVNKNWHPKSFMIDLDQREIGALQDVFKGVKVFLCDFHREQAWDRWFNKRENGAHGSKNQTIQYLRQIARSRTEDELKENVKALQETEVYKNNSRFRAWIERYWLANTERWVRCFRTTSMNLKVNTTNGIEVHHKLLKEKYLHGKGSSKTLTNLLTEITQNFIPDIRERYIRENVAARNTSRQYSDNVPLFLRERPQRFVKHCMKRIYTGDSLRFTENENGFIVQSNSGNEYQVDCDQPSCTCEDFQKFYWPCKHLLGVMIQYPGYGWDFLPQEYKELPVFNTDFHPNEILPSPHDENMPESGANTEGNSEDSRRDYLIEVLKELQNDIYIADEETLSEVQLHLVAALDTIKKKQSVALPIRPCRKKKRSAFSYGTQNETMEEDIKGVHLPGKSSLPRDNGRQLDADVCSAQVYSSPYLPDGFNPEQNKGVCNDVQVDLDEDFFGDSTEAVMPEFFMWKFTEEDEEEVDRIWFEGARQMVLGHIGPHCLTERSFEFIKNTQSDEVIDAFLHVIVSNYENVLHISCVTMTAIFDGQRHIHGLLRRHNLMNYETIIGAHNEGGNHWILMIIKPRSSEIIHCNPLGTLFQLEQQLIYHWYSFLKCRYDAGLEEVITGEWTVKSPEHARQIDGTSCGIYVLKFAENYLAGKSLLFQWTSGDLYAVRKCLALFLMSSLRLKRHSLASIQSNMSQQIGREERRVEEEGTQIEDEKTEKDEEGIKMKEEITEIMDKTSEMKSRTERIDQKKEEQTTEKDEEEIEVENTTKKDGEETEAQEEITEEDKEKAEVEEKITEKVKEITEIEEDITEEDEEGAEVQEEGTQIVEEGIQVVEERSEIVEKETEIVGEVIETDNNRSKLKEDGTVREEQKTETEKEEGRVPSPVFRRTIRPHQPKRKRSSFIYYTTQREKRKRYCSCKKPDDGKLYWQCENCQNWFHPQCIDLTEEEEPEHFVCDGCKPDEQRKVTAEHSEKKEENKLTIENLSSIWNSIVHFLESVAVCNNDNCDEPEHQRHHSFTKAPLEYIRKEKKLFGFGSEVFDIRAVDWLHMHLQSLVTFHANPIMPAVSAKIPTLRFVEKKSRLYSLFLEYDCLTSYLMCIMHKEAMIFSLCSIKKWPYELAEERCLRSEMNSKVVFGK